MWCLIEQNCQESHKRKDFAESLCCIRKQGFESASADCCRVKSVAPCSPELHLSLARFASYSTLTFFFFFLLLLRCNFFPKTHPVVFISLVLLVTLSRCLSVFQPSYCEKPLQTNSPLSLIDSLSLSVSLPFFSAVLLLWAVRYIHFSLQSFTIFPTFFLPFFHPFFFLISYSSALLNPLPPKYLCTLWTHYTQGQDSNSDVHKPLAQPSSLGSRTSDSKWTFPVFIDLRVSLFVRDFIFVFQLSD